MEDLVEFEQVSVTMPQCNIPYTVGGAFTGDVESWLQYMTVFASDYSNAFPACTKVVFKFRPIDMGALWGTTQEYVYTFSPFIYGLDRVLESEQKEFYISVTYPINPTLTNPDFILPENTNTVESEAFEGISAKRVKVSNRVTTIGSKAFANCLNLEGIYIPSSCTTIADDAFDNDNKLIIYCHEDSYAMIYAMDHNIEYGIIDI